MTAPRPLQQLLGILQFNQQQQLAEQEAARAKAATSANIVNTFMTLAPLQPQKDRTALAQLLGKAAGVDPAMLMGAVAERPMAAATVGDTEAGMRFQGITQPALQRAASMAGQIPDASILDAATNAATGAISGMNAGQARQAAMSASRAAISDKQLVEGLTNQMGLTLTADQRKQYEVQAEQLRQGWTRLADDKTAEAARLAIMRGQLMLEQQKMTLLASGKVQEAQQLNFGNPEENLKALNSLMTTATSGAMSKEAKAGYAAAMSALAKQLAAQISVADPALGQQFLSAFDPERILNFSPGKTESFFGVKTKK